MSIVNGPVTTPVLFIIFRRPEETQQVFNTIRQAKPRRLFVCADGPRPQKHGEAELCARTRAIIDQVDWDCEVHTKFSDINLGCRIAVRSGIDWFLEHVESGIILEDDCLPSQSFFWFCQELLERYKDDERVMQISGVNYISDRIALESSYYFSRFNCVWGWATWRRAWSLYDENMKGFDDFRRNGTIRNYYHDRDVAAYVMSYMEEAAFSEEPTIWSTAWTYTRCLHNGLTILPNIPLVVNVGLNDDGTNFSDSYSGFPRPRLQEMEVIKHPSSFVPLDKVERTFFDFMRRFDPHGGWIRQLKTRSRYDLKRALGKDGYSQFIKVWRWLHGRKQVSG